MSAPIQVWQYHDAPEYLRQLSPHGGDEDWLAVVAPEYADVWIPWLERGSFGVCGISRHDMPTGETVYIGAHS